MRRAVAFNGRLKAMPYYTSMRTSKPDIKRYTDKYRKVRSDRYSHRSDHSRSAQPAEDIRAVLQKKLASVAPEELLKGSLKGTQKQCNSSECISSFTGRGRMSGTQRDVQS